MIRLEQAEKQYKNFHLDCSVEVQEGMVTGLIGPNGAGKSTTFRLLTGLARPDAGRITIFGKEISGITAERPEEDWRGLVRCWIFRIPHGKRSDCRIKKYVSGI